MFPLLIRRSTVLCALMLLTLNVPATFAAPPTSTQVMPVTVGPVMPPMALPPLPSGVYGSGSVLPGFTELQSPRLYTPRSYTPRFAQPRAYVPVGPCPTHKLFANNIMIFGTDATTDMCVNGILHPGLKVGDTIDGMKIMGIDTDVVSVRGRRGVQKITTSSK